MKEGFYICKQCEGCAFHKERPYDSDVCVYFRELMELQPDEEMYYDAWYNLVMSQYDRDCPHHISKEESWEILRQYVDNNRR